MRFSASALALTLVTLPLTLSLPLHERDVSLTAAQVLAIAPKSNTCDGAPAAGQCRTAAQAAPMILNSFKAYQITSPAEMAAIIGTMAFESGDFKYDRPIKPDPGKGTRNMQSAAFNKKFAMSIPGLKEKFSQGLNDPNGIIDLLTANDVYDFGSGAWFLTTQCDATIRSGLAGGSLTGWQAYITRCLFTTVTPERQAYWERAMHAFGGK